MKRLFTLLLMAILTASSHIAMADCPLEQNMCINECNLKHEQNEAAQLGCKSRCAGKRALCSTQHGAETAVDFGGDLVDSGVEASKNAWEGTKSFFRGMTEE
ncbi:hypothetical protein ACFVYJ_09155 [Pontibacter sp. JAM-7]|uniref:hypothetical protein n=1 Tax=Pontibacter sp. JAM-7 TaxID=3366581 RepID=UPI003AF5D794